MSKILLNTYTPLCYTKYGRKAIEKYGFAPYIDCSCRREPDFVNPFPSITALCRGRGCAPRLNERDRIVYMTVKGNYDNFNERHNRLVAILEIYKRFESHEKAASWYKEQGIALPSNCLVEGNPPLSVDKTIGLKSPLMKRILKRSSEHQNKQLDAHIAAWDKEYWDKCKKYPVFLTCKKIFLELQNPPIITSADLKKIFGRVPGTQTPPEISEEEYNTLVNKILK